MKKLVTVFILLSVSITAQWSDKTDIPTKRWGAASTVYDGKIYVFGGQSDVSPYSSMDAAQVYDPGADTWTTLSPMGTSRWGASAVVLSDLIFVIGGLNGSFNGGFSSINSVEVYDPAADTWSIVGNLNTARGYAGAEIYDGTILIISGYSTQTTNEVATVEQFSLGTGEWTIYDTVQTPRSTFMTAEVNQKIYIIGGWSDNTLEEYDPSTKQFTTKTQMPTARGGSGIAVWNDLIYVVGGRGGSSTEFEVYDPSADSWSALTDMPTAREGLIAGIVDGVLYAIAGSAPLSAGGFPFYTKNEAYDVVTGIDDNNSGRVSKDFYLNQNYPNPFNPVTNIDYYLPEYSLVKVKVFDITGREIAVLFDGYCEPGAHTIVFNSDKIAGVSSGVYFYRIKYRSDDEFRSATGKMVLMK